jgi:hypothetical protein
MLVGLDLLAWSRFTDERPTPLNLAQADVASILGGR